VYFYSDVVEEMYMKVTLGFKRLTQN